MAIITRDVGLGEKLGTGIGETLKSLAANRLDRIHQQEAMQQQQARQQAGLKPLFGENANALGLLSSDLLQPLIREKAKGQNQLETTGPGLRTIIPQLSEEQANKIGKLSPGLQQLWYRGYQESPQEAINAINNLQNAFPGLGTKEAPQKSAEIKSLKENIPAQTTEAQTEISRIRDLIKENSPVVKNVSELVKEGLTRKEAHEQTKDLRKADAVATKESEKYYHDLLKSESAGASGLKRLDRMENLIEKGSLPFAALYKSIKGLAESDIKTHIPVVGPFADIILNTVAKGIGTPLEYGQKAITARDTEEFEKLSQDFIKDAKDIYGGRVTNYEAEQFLKTIPNLLQTDNGKRAVIHNMRNFIDAVKIKAENAKKIIKANHGKRPANLEILVDEISKPELDRLADEFRSGGIKSTFPQPPEKSPVSDNSTAMDFVKGGARGVANAVIPGIGSLI